MLRISENPDHWRLRAREARDIAAHCSDLETTHLMLGFALAYDDLAERAKGRREPTGTSFMPRSAWEGERRSRYLGSERGE